MAASNWSALLPIRLADFAANQGSPNSIRWLSIAGRVPIEWRQPTSGRQQRRRRRQLERLFFLSAQRERKFSFKVSADATGLKSFNYLVQAGQVEPTSGAQADKWTDDEGRQCSCERQQTIQVMNEHNRSSFSTCSSLSARCKSTSIVDLQVAGHSPGNLAQLFALCRPLSSLWARQVALVCLFCLLLLVVVLPVAVLD